jgi:hypothetical protein
MLKVLQLSSTSAVILHY